MRHESDLLNKKEETERQGQKLLCPNEKNGRPSFLHAGRMTEEAALDFLASLLVDILLSKYDEPDV